MDLEPIHNADRLKRLDNLVKVWTFIPDPVISGTFDSLKKQSQKQTLACLLSNESKYLQKFTEAAISRYGCGPEDILRTTCHLYKELDHYYNIIPLECARDRVTILSHSEDSVDWEFTVHYSNKSPKVSLDLFKKELDDMSKKAARNHKRLYLGLLVPIGLASDMEKSFNFIYDVAFI